MLCVIANTTAISFFDYRDREALTNLNIAIRNIDFAFIIIYFVEAFLKIIAMGLIFNKYSYLRDPGNILDIIIIGTG